MAWKWPVAGSSVRLAVVNTGTGRVELKSRVRGIASPQNDSEVVNHYAKYCTKNRKIKLCFFVPQKNLPPFSLFPSNIFSFTDFSF